MKRSKRLRRSSQTPRRSLPSKLASPSWRAATASRSTISAASLPSVERFVTRGQSRSRAARPTTAARPHWPLVDAVEDALRLLERNPDIAHALRGRLHALRSLRVGTYRIIYQLAEDDQTVRVVAIRHRSIAYRIDHVDAKGRIERAMADNGTVTLEITWQGTRRLATRCPRNRFGRALSQCDSGHRCCASPCGLGSRRQSLTQTGLDFNRRHRPDGPELSWMSSWS